MDLKMYCISHYKWWLSIAMLFCWWDTNNNNKQMSVRLFPCSLLAMVPQHPSYPFMVSFPTFVTSCPRHMPVIKWPWSLKCAPFSFSLSHVGPVKGATSCIDNVSFDDLPSIHYTIWIYDNHFKRWVDFDGNIPCLKTCMAIQWWILLTCCLLDFAFISWDAPPAKRSHTFLWGHLNLTFTSQRCGGDTTHRWVAWLVVIVVSNSKAWYIMYLPQNWLIGSALEEINGNCDNPKNEHTYFRYVSTSHDRPQIGGCDAPLT